MNLGLRVPLGWVWAADSGGVWAPDEYAVADTEAGGASAQANAERRSSNTPTEEQPPVARPSLQGLDGEKLNVEATLCSP